MDVPIESWLWHIVLGTLIEPLLVHDRTCMLRGKMLGKVPATLRITHMKLVYD